MKTILLITLALITIQSHAQQNPKEGYGKIGDGSGSFLVINWVVSELKTEDSE